MPHRVNAPIILLLAICAIFLHERRLSGEAGSTGPVRLAKGLVFTTTSHSGLATTNGTAVVADTEAVYSVAEANENTVTFSFTFSAPPESSGGKLLDGVPHSLERSVRREDLRSATRLTVMYSSSDPRLIPGQTFASTSSAVLEELHASGKAAFVLGVNEPEEGLEGLGNLDGNAPRPADRSSGQAFVASGVASLMSALGVSRHYYRGTVERIRTERFSVLLNGRRTTVPAIHVRGKVTFRDRTLTPELWWLDDPENPLTLRWRIGGVYETVTRIDFPQDANTSDRTSAAQSLSGKNCRAELNGIYFTTASAKVLDASRPALERFATAVKAHPDWHVTIEGHTDNIGAANYNLDLSVRRAAAVREVLISQFRVSAEQLKSKGYGMTRPVESNSSDEGRAHNRRVEVSLPCGGGA